MADGATVDVEIVGNTVIVSGEVDMNTAPAVEKALLDCVGNGIEDIVLDISEVTYFDSSGIKALLAAREAIDGSATIKIIGVNNHTDRVFRLIGLERFFEITACV